jgi:uncharacterized protein (TIGR02246 family)
MVEAVRRTHPAPSSDPTHDRKGNVMTSNNASLVEADRAVRAVLDEVYAAWAANDADAFVAPYAETATAVLPGTYLPDRQAIRATMATLFAGELNGSKGLHEVQTIRFVGTDVAVVISKGAMLLTGQTEPDAANRALETWVLPRQAATWRVQAFCNCPEHPA